MLLECFTKIRLSLTFVLGTIMLLLATRSLRAFHAVRICNKLRHPNVSVDVQCGMEDCLVSDVLKHYVLAYYRTHRQASVK
jgi:hypothetical protein